MMNSFLKITLLLLVILLPMMFFHQWIIGSFESDYFYPLWSVYFFHFSVTIIILLGLYWVHRSRIFHTGFAFLVGSFLRIGASVFFFIPLLLSEQTASFWEVISFIIPYFVCLTIEAVYAISLLRKEEKPLE